MTKLLIITYIPSPYQVELFNAIALAGKFDLQVAYLSSWCKAPIAQQWRQPELNHQYLILDDEKVAWQQLQQELEASELVVFNYYRHPRLEQLMERCLELNKPWCFWGERPGVKHAGLLGWLFRRWKLAALHHSEAPIWGVGIWGVEQYRREFGLSRTYFDVPYFSDLQRFVPNLEKKFAPERRVLLYSGALIQRKGVDLLAQAFTSLAEEFPRLKLHILGEGPLLPALKQQLAEYQNRVQFLGFQPWEKLPYYYSQADILCVPSRYDGWGMVVPEGLAAGLPVISTNRTGAAIELIRDGHNGWLIDADSETALREAMGQAVSLSSSELAAYSQAAQERAAQHALAQGRERWELAASATIQQFSASPDISPHLKRLMANS